MAKEYWLASDGGRDPSQSGGQVLYAWSVYAAALIQELGFTKTQAMLPHTVALAMVALMMVPGGKLFDKYGTGSSFYRRDADGHRHDTDLLQTTIPGFIVFFRIW